jgi:hypothetical protein
MFLAGLSLNLKQKTNKARKVSSSLKKDRQYYKVMQR